MSDERYAKKQSLPGRFLDGSLVIIYRWVNKCLPWHRLWKPLGLANLVALRVELRRHNLHDTDGDLTQPKLDFTADFTEDDLPEPVTLINRLIAQSDPVAAVLWNRMEPAIQTILQSAHTPLLRKQSELVFQLNRIIGGPSIYDQQLFAAVQLSAQTANLIAKDPKGEELSWFNRWLLEDAFTIQLKRNRGQKRVCPFHAGPGATHQRTEDGTMNDLNFPAMGCRFSRLGRNMRSLRPIDDKEPGLLHPNPLLISERLMKRDGNFKAATTLNLLAGAWIQFQVHDWFGHENEHQDAGKDIHVPRAGDWPPSRPDLLPLLDPKEMVLPMTKPDPTNEKPLNARYPAYRNKDPQWWDGSQVYGESIQETLRLRTNSQTHDLCPDGKLYLDSQGLLPRDERGHVLSGFTDNWWLGTELLHTLFAKEHNAICERLREREPYLTSQEIFEAARLVNCAVMAKIHTVEWTPGILGHPTIQPALNLNWKGLMGYLLSEKKVRALAHWWPEWFLKDAVTGVPLSETDHHGAPYALTEEFNAVYRLHPLIPDEVPIRNSQTGELRQAYDMESISFERARTPLKDGASCDDVLYSFLVAHPGQITIRNYPDFLRALKVPADPDNGRTKDQVMDLAAVDIIRDRERGVPRYNEFRRQLRMKPAESWEELAGCRPDLAKVLEEVYEGQLENVDTMVGMFCENLPEGFGFSDTAFRVFILMASRRLKSDRFFTTDYTEEFYTKSGLDWIAETGMATVILRHHPELRSALKKDENPFAPWQTVSPKQPAI